MQAARTGSENEIQCIASRLRRESVQLVPFGILAIEPVGGAGDRAVCSWIEVD